MVYIKQEANPVVTFNNTVMNDSIYTDCMNTEINYFIMQKKYSCSVPIMLQDQKYTTTTVKPLV